MPANSAIMAMKWFFTAIGRWPSSGTRRETMVSSSLGSLSARFCHGRRRLRAGLSIFMIARLMLRGTDVGGQDEGLNINGR